MGNILVVEDNASMREMLENILEEQGYTVAAAPDVSTAMMLLRSRPFSVILSDLQLPDMDGLTFFKRTRSLHIPFIILTAYGSIEQAVAAMKEGAFDFIAKPVDPEYLLLMIEKALESTRILRENIVFKEVFAQNLSRPNIIGRSRGILRAADQLKQVAVTDTPVLLLGESGTGKELFARAIHSLSPRKDQPFLAVNSASIPENLLENELFGHEKGAYTDAYLRQIGKLELTQGGTFFLDEIGDLPINLQGKILRVIEEKKVSRIGSNQEVHLDVRFVFATNKEIEEEMNCGRFRKDLYFRISIFPITLPPLRERREDILLLANYFVKKFSVELKKRELTFSAAAETKLLGYPWPGNVRELQNTVERALIIAHGKQIEGQDIILPEGNMRLPEELNLEGSLKEVTDRALKLVEKQKIEAVLNRVAFNRTRAARELGVSYKTLLNKIKAYGIRPPH